ncbi:archaeosortase A, PGF-CTERM-specific [Haloplanus vescus]|uniref:Archaeosortase A, PGF-CTERM-specific n=1 Tax=Haloplanus vescus TaxID=555874 RepID=A0A1H3VLY1_9EURY|nr:archaeosortase A [Haloplanus vescus]SDZ75759.1 archaeosortase A, PGF-CTERM-specific [Haloplanus vescus]
MAGPLTDALAWAVVGLFLLGVLLRWRESDYARAATVGAWGVFAVFWAALVPHFAFVQKSFVEGFLSLAAVPASLYVGYLLYDGRDSLFVLSRAVAVMGVVYLPFETIPALTLWGVSLPSPRYVLISHTTGQTQWAMELLGYSPTLVEGDQGYLNTFKFVTEGGHIILFSIILACTGLGSIAIFVGLIAAVEAPLSRKVRALAIAVPVIYVLNIARTTFIGLMFGKQYMQWFVDEILFLFGGTDPYKVSFYISDRIISQVLAVVALVGVTYLVVRELPELLTIVEDVLYVVTREEYDLREALDLPEQSDVGPGAD